MKREVKPNKLKEIDNEASGVVARTTPSGKMLFISATNVTVEIEEVRETRQISLELERFEVKNINEYRGGTNTATIVMLTKEAE